MNSNSKCPTAGEFGQLVEGQISNLRCEQLVDHLAACLRCAEAAEQVLANSSIGQALGGHLPDQLPPDDVIEPIIARMRELVLDRSSGGTPTLAAHAASPETVPELEACHDMAAFFAPPQTANELGRLGGFRILNFLGAGGMGVVFLAEDPLLKRQVALKVLRPSLAVHPGSRERFLREARAMAAVQHDRIMHINQVGADRRVPFLAMPYLPGETLADRLNRDKKLAVADAVRIAREVAEGLSAAHQRGLIHRDIKPSNIWLEGAHCRVKILDFGLVRTLQEDIQLTRSGNILGTPAYMSPEQASGGEVDDRSDLFSLGCVMYHMCTGHEPFRVGHPAAILLAVMTQDPRPPVQLESELPLALSQLIVRMLAKKSERRPDSADAVVEELRTIEASLIQQPGPPPPAPAARSSISKKILGVALGVISVAILVAGIVIVRVRNNDGSIVELRTTAEEVEVETDGHTPVKVRRSEHFPVVKDASRPPVKAAASPFDQLNRENIPLHELAAAGNGDPAQAPAELVAVFGDSRLKHWATVNDVEFTKDGRLLVSASDDSTVRLWDTGTGKMVRQLDTEGPTHCLAITPDEKRVVAGFQTSIRIWQIATGQVLRTLTPTRDIPAQIWSLATSPNPELPLVAATCHYSGTITVWNLDTGQELRNIPAHKSTIIDLDFSHDGKWLASAGADDGTAKIWDVETGELLHSFDAQTFVGGVQFTSDGDQLVIGSRQEITIRDTNSGELLRTIPEGADRFVLTPDGDGILIARAYQAWLLRFDSPKEHLAGQRHFFSALSA